MSRKFVPKSESPPEEAVSEFRFKKKFKTTLRPLDNEDVIMKDVVLEKTYVPPKEVPDVLFDKKMVTSSLYESRIKEPPPFEEGAVSIGQIKFSIMSDEEVVALSVCNIFDPNESGKNTVFDPRMGAVNTYDTCETCGQGWKMCPGHFGSIKLNAVIPHPLCSKKILSYLRLFCFSCSRLIFLEEKLKMLSVKPTIKNLLEIADKKVNVCPHNECKKMLPEFNFDEDKYFYSNKEGTKYPLSNDEMWRIFDNVRDADISLLNLDSEYIHPRNCLITILPVVPPCCRPYCISNGLDNPNQDDLTVKYMEIIKTNDKLGKAIKDKNEKAKDDMINILNFHIHTLMDNSKGKARDNSAKRALRSFKQRISGKTGHIRGNIEGKRANLNGRTVVGPEAFGHVNEITIPEEISKTLTRSIHVNERNLQECQALVDEGKVNYVKRGKRNHDLKTRRKECDIQFSPSDEVIRNGKSIKPWFAINSGKKFKMEMGDEFYRNGEKTEFMLPTQFLVKPGDIIERHLKNGDWVVLNRQPTLWKGSMQGKKVRILPGKTFRFNLACTQAFNADFDGDEMNIHLPQSTNAVAEVSQLMTIDQTFISCQDSKPMVTIKQDTMSGSYRLTLVVKNKDKTFSKIKVDKDLFFDILTWIDQDRVAKKTAHIKKVLFSKKSGGPENIQKIKEQIAHAHTLIKRAKTKETKDRHMKTINLLEAQIKNVDITDEEFYNGHNLLSYLLPNDFEYVCDNNISPDGMPLTIERGVFICGTLNKEALGNVSGSLIHHIAKDYGNTAAVEFISELQIFINAWLQHAGITVSLEDCIPVNSNLIESEMNKAILEAYAAMQTEKDPEIVENKISVALYKTAGIGQKLAKEALKDDNHMVTMIKSGSKGNWFNIAQVTGLVGQQFLSAARLPKMFGGRTLPHFRRCGYLTKSVDTVLDLTSEEEKLKDALHLFQSRGFIVSSYYKGLKPAEYFFHATAAREGLLDTSTKTSTTGYIQRKITKLLEDLQTTYIGSVATPTQRVVQFAYGGDGLSADRLIKTRQGLSFIDVAHTVQKLNKEIEILE